MSTPDSGQSATATAQPQGTQAPKPPHRMLACVLCQQRKVKCSARDTGSLPCENCTRQHVQCVPASVTRQRRRRFPERELLDRLRRYEGLLRENNVKFDPLHGGSQEKSKSSRAVATAVATGSQTFKKSPASEESPVSGRTERDGTEEPIKERNFWHAMDHKSRDIDDDSTDSSLDDLRDNALKNAWNEMPQAGDYLLFGSRQSIPDLTPFHPEQFHIFRLWQIYLDNVNPLLKVTHTPTLQSRIIEAGSNVRSIKPELAALMFSIYCLAITSLLEEECQTMFGAERESLLAKYQLSCQQALSNCGYLRSTDRDCLTALYLYLLSIKPYVDPDSLSSILGVTIRIAQRMGLHSEAALARCSPLEAEMRRRLWWSIVLYDTRIAEMSDFKTAILTPIWDCRVPLNVNDFDLQPEMKSPPQVQGLSTEALYMVVRSEVGDFLRNCTFQIDFIAPPLKALAKSFQNEPIPAGGEIDIIERMIEDKYLQFCNPDNPLQYMTIWSTRASLARCRLFEHYSTFALSSTGLTDDRRDAAMLYAFKMLECDTKLQSSSLIKGYQWFNNFTFPFLAYLHLAQDLKRRPLIPQADEAWNTMSDNYRARFSFWSDNENPFYQIFTKIMIQAWDAKEKAAGKISGDPPVPPDIIVSIRAKFTSISPTNNIEHQVMDFSGMTMDDFTASMSMELSAGGGGGRTFTFPGTGLMSSAAATVPSLGGVTRQDLADDMSQLDWMSMDWNPMHQRGW